MLLAEHGGAVDYDLMTCTRFTLDDLGGALSLRALRHFLEHIPPDSATARELGRVSGEQQRWREPEMLPMLVAQLIDEVRQMEFLFACANSGKGKRPRPPEQIPRPGIKPKGHHYGSDPIPIRDFDKWWKEG